MATILATTVSGDGHYYTHTAYANLSDFLWVATTIPPMPPPVSDSGILELTRVGWFAIGPTSPEFGPPDVGYIGWRRYISFEREDWNMLNDSRSLFNFVAWHIAPGWAFSIEVDSY